VDDRDKIAPAAETESRAMPVSAYREEIVSLFTVNGIETVSDYSRWPVVVAAACTCRHRVHL